jgi:hypothetical protein
LPEKVKAANNVIVHLMNLSKGIATEENINLQFTSQSSLNSTSQNPYFAISQIPNFVTHPVPIKNPH